MSSFRRSLRLALPLFLVACDGNIAGPDVDPPALSRADAQSLLLAFAPQMQRSVATLSAGSGSTTVQTVACPRGGSLRASLESATSTGGVVRLVHADCRVDGPDGRTWTINGNPNLQLAVSPATISGAAGGEVIIPIAMKGTLRVAGGSVSGPCAIDTNLQIRMSTMAPHQSTARFTGTVCGESVDETTTATAS